MSFHKATFLNSQYSDCHIIPPWPVNHFISSYSVPYSINKTVENKRKTAFFFLSLLFLLITSLIVSLLFVIWYFNPLQTNSDYVIGSLNNKFLGINSLDASSELPFLKNHLTKPTKINQTHVLNENLNNYLNEQKIKDLEPSNVDYVNNEDDGFGEKPDNHSDYNSSYSNQNATNKELEYFRNYYNNYKPKLNPNQAVARNHHEEKLDGEFVDHHTMSTLDEDNTEQNFIFTPSTLNNENISLFLNNLAVGEQPSIQSSTEANFDLGLDKKSNLPDSILKIKARQFCNLENSVENSNSKANNLNKCRLNSDSKSISSYFCGDKFVILAKIKKLKERSILSQASSNEKQLVSKYDIAIERVLKRSPLSVAFKRQELRTKITINSTSNLNNNLNLPKQSADQGAQTEFSCDGQPLDLEIGQTYLLSGRIFGLSAVSSNCDVKLEWYNDLSPKQRSELFTWSAAKHVFNHC